MRNLSGTYVRRGDAIRRRKRIRRALFAAASVIATVVVIAVRRPGTAGAEPVNTTGDGFFTHSSSRALRSELETTRGELHLVRAQFERADKVIEYSNKFNITAGMASKIFDASLREGLDPELAFRLVRLESEFNEHAVSKVGALGLTQLMPSTALLYDRTMTRERLFNGDANLRVGFRYLRTLIDGYKGNVRLALLAYNRGEDAVTRDVRAGVNPGNGYDHFVMRDYRGSGLLK
jgi:hypothetical protein